METNKRALLIGLFVICSLFLLFVSVWVLGSGTIFSNKAKYVMYFDESTKGLRKGGKVSFKGVTVGEVLEVNVIVEDKNFSAINQVIISIDRDRLRTDTDETSSMFKSRNITEKYIEKGLKAQLQMESLVTGVLMINLDFDTSYPIRLYDRSDDDSYTELPTKASGIAQFAQSLDKIDLQGLITKISNAISNIEEATKDVNLKQMIENFEDTLAKMKEMSNNSASVMAKLDKNILPILDNINKFTTDASDALIELKESAQGIKNIVGKDSKFKYQLEKTLDSMERASKSIATLSDYLSRNPNAVVFGKK